MNDAQWGVFMENASDINDAVAEGGKVEILPSIFPESSPNLSRMFPKC